MDNIYFYYSIENNFGNLGGHGSEGVTEPPQK
jgi:hypothetical protein